MQALTDEYVSTIAHARDHDPSAIIVHGKDGLTRHFDCRGNVTLTYTTDGGVRIGEPPPLDFGEHCAPSNFTLAIVALSGLIFVAGWAVGMILGRFA